MKTDETALHKPRGKLYCFLTGFPPRFLCSSLTLHKPRGKLYCFLTGFPPRFLCSSLTPFIILITNLLENSRNNRAKPEKVIRQ